MLKFPALKSVLKVCTIVAALAFGSSTMKADQISFSGADAYSTSSGAVTFYDANGSGTPGNAYVTAFSATGVFTPYQNGTVTFNNFNYLTSPTPFELMNVVANGDTARFLVSILSYTSDANGLSIFGSGYYTVNGVRKIDGTFKLTTQGGGDGSTVVSFSDTNFSTVTPEPSSLMLLGTGLVSTAGMMLRRRRNTLA